MPKQEGQKTKLLVLLRIFEQLSDEDHRLTVPQLTALLAKRGVLSERKSIYDDIETLQRLGYDIRLRRGRGGGYWLASRTFDLAELKLLVDAVQASKAIPKTASDRLISKLESLTSHYQGSQLQRQVYVEGRPKTSNRSLPYAVDALFEAIQTGKMVTFRYKNDRVKRSISPWHMVWENGCYYLIAYQDEKSPAGIRHYRVDRMAEVQVQRNTPRRGQQQLADFDLPAYLRKHFEMYSGPEYRVTLRCDADLEAAMRERFGHGPIFVPEEDGRFHFDVPICASPRFYGWVCGFGGKVEIVAPAEVRGEFYRLAEHLAQQHG